MTNNCSFGYSRIIATLTSTADTIIGKTNLPKQSAHKALLWYFKQSSEWPSVSQGGKAAISEMLCMSNISHNAWHSHVPPADLSSRDKF
jgi:hypothetical protein